MAFVLPDYDNSDRVTFYVRKDFSDRPGEWTHYIDRNDDKALIYYIRMYMDTNVKVRRPGTPAKLIMPSLPDYYEPLH